MSIECSPSPQASSAPPRAQGTASAGQQSGGFASLMQGLSHPVAVSPTQAAAPSPDPAGFDPVLAQDQGSANDSSVQGLRALSHRTQLTASAVGSAAANGEPAPSTSKTSADTTDLTGAGPALPQGALPDAAAQALLAQFLGLAGGHGTQATSGAGGDGALNPDLARVRPAAAAPALPAGTAPPGQGTGTSAEFLAGFNLPGTAGDPSLTAVVGHSGATRWLPMAQAQGPIPWQSTLASQSAGEAAQLSLASVRDAGSNTTTQPLTGSAQATSAAALVTALAESDVGFNGRRRGGASIGSEPIRLDGPTPAGMGGTVIGSSQAGVVASGATASGQPVERAVAEQVKYWISNDIHNAELKFDGLGSEPVQVSISMSGNEAQVVFRSDQAQTRELLGNAMTQLDQMLRAEGLTLAGAWVGSSGQQGQFGAHSQQAQAGQERTPMATQQQAVVTPAPARLLVATDRAVDLFV